MRIDKKYIIIILSFITLLSLIFVFSTVGSVNLSLGEILSALKNNDNKVVTTIVYKAITTKYFS